MGFLPHALLNALARLGWSYGDQEKFTLDELVEKFSLEHVGKSAGVFNAEKLLDLNAQYIRESESADLSEEIIPFLKRLGCDSFDREKLVPAIETLQPRSKTLQEMAEGALFYFQDEITYEPKADKKFLKRNLLDLLVEITGRLEQSPRFDQKALEDLFVVFLEEREIKLGKIAQPIRVALTGKTASPGLFEVMEVLGKEAVLRRLNQAVKHIRSKN
jgi:glutamyl-tRNA synthetase